MECQQAGNQIKLVVLREEEGGGDITTDGEGDRTSMSSGNEINSSWVGFNMHFDFTLFWSMLESLLILLLGNCRNFKIPIPILFPEIN